MSRQMTQNQFYSKDDIDRESIDRLESVVPMSIQQEHMACVLLLDTSDSMRGKKIKSLSEGVKRFKENVLKDDLAKKRVDIAIVTFNDYVEVVSDFCPISQMPIPDLVTGGRTNIADAIDVSIELVKKRTELYSKIGTPHYKPWIFLITDGLSTSEPDRMREVAERIKEEEEKGSHGRLTFWALGVGEFDKDELFSLTNMVLELKNEDFNGIFDWLSDSMSIISQTRIGQDVELSAYPENVSEVDRV